jgi:hypothetical protein
MWDMTGRVLPARGTLIDDFSPLINELWPRLEDDKYWWELHS